MLPCVAIHIPFWKLGSLDNEVVFHVTSLQIHGFFWESSERITTQQILGTCLPIEVLIVYQKRTNKVMTYHDPTVSIGGALESSIQSTSCSGLCLRPLWSSQITWVSGDFFFRTKVQGRIISWNILIIVSSRKPLEKVQLTPSPRKCCPGCF